MIPPLFQIARIPLTVFFQPRDFGDKITLLSRLRDASDGALDGDPLVLPLPPNQPAELPRLQIESRDKTLLMQATLDRLNLEWNRRGPAPPGWDATAPRFLGMARNILRVFVGEYARAVRFAANPHFFLRLDRSANEYLSTYVLQPDRVLDRPRSMRIGLHETLKIGERAWNLWMNVATARNQKNPQDDDGLIVHFDFNSIPEDPRPLTAEEILESLEALAPMMDARLRAFFNDLPTGED